MNVTTLSKVAQSSRAADLVFKYLAGRDRATWSMNLGRMYAEITSSGASLSRADFDQVFESLQKAGAGTTVHGRRGGTSRFMWNYNFREAATQTLSSIQAAKAPVKLEAKHEAISPTVIQLTIPTTMSQKDIQALIELVNSAGK